MSCGCEPGQFQKLVAEAAGVKRRGTSEHRSYFCTVALREVSGGAERGIYLSGRLMDDLQCAYLQGLMGFWSQGDHRLKEMDGSVYDTWQAGGVVPVYCMLDNEEVGSDVPSRSAASTF